MQGRWKGEVVRVCGRVVVEGRWKGGGGEGGWKGGGGRVGW